MSSHANVLRYVVNHLEADQDDPNGKEQKLSSSERRQDLSELDECIEILGGRLTDLEFLARRLKTGQSPKKALQEIIEQSASEIIKMYLLDAGDSDAASRKWSSQQAWHLISSLAQSETLRYNEVLLSPTFTSSLTTPSPGESILESLSQAELISIKAAKGRPQSITPGKPVYQAAFKLLTSDTVLKARLDLAVITELSKVETKNIEKYEGELTVIKGLHGEGKQPYEVRSRTQFLLAKLQASQKKVEAWDMEINGLKKVLTKEY